MKSTYTKKINDDDRFLLAIGCSFTDAHFKPPLHKQHPDDNYDFPKWPELVGKEFDLNSVNRADSGGSNTKIFNDAVEQIAIHGDKIAILAIGWTDFNRFSLWGKNYNFGHVHPEHSSLPTFTNGSTDKSIYGVFKHVCLHMTPGNRDLLERCINQNFRQVYYLQELCKKVGIKFVCATLLWEMFGEQIYNTVTQMYDIEPISYEEIVKVMMEDEYFYKIDPRTYIDWPKQTGLWSDFSTKLHEEYRFNIDTHPNKEGHEMFARAFIDRIYNLYAKEYVC